MDGSTTSDGNRSGRGKAANIMNAISSHADGDGSGNIERVGE